MRKGQKTVGQALPVGRGPTTEHPVPPGRTTGIATHHGNQRCIQHSDDGVRPRAGSNFGGNRPPVDQRGLAAVCELCVCVRSEAVQRAVLPAFGARWPQHDPSAQLPGLRASEDGRTLIAAGWPAHMVCDDDGSRCNHKHPENKKSQDALQQQQHLRPTV